MVSLQKGGKVNLKKEDNSLKVIEVGLGWDTKTDLDSMAFLFDVSGKLRKTVCFTSKNHTGIFLNGDNLTGEGEGDDEIITVTLEELPSWVKRISFGANIFAAKWKLWGVKDFSQVNGAYIRIVNSVTKREICRYDLKEVGKGFDAFHFADLVRLDNDEWEFVSIGKGMKGSIDSLGQQIEKSNV